MKRIVPILVALLSLSTASACIKKSVHPSAVSNQPLTVIVMDTTQALLSGAEVKVQKKVYTTSFDGRVVLKPEQVSSSTFLVSCEGYKPAHAIVKDSAVLIVRLLPDGKKKRPGNEREVMTLGMARTGVRYSKVAAEPSVMMEAAVMDAAVMEAGIPVGYGTVSHQPSAGLLTAGEVNDFAKWKLWPGVLEGSHQAFVKDWKISARHRYTVQVTNPDGYPIASRAVSLLDNAGNTLFQAVTDNTGKAELWYRMTNDEMSAAKPLNGELMIRVDDRKQVAKDWYEGINAFVLDEECPNSQMSNDKSQISNDVDVMFVFDATGSMGDELRYLQAEMQDVIARAGEATGGLMIRTGAVVYRDHGDEYLTRLSRLSPDIATTQRFIDRQEANGGGDYPEALPEALMAAMNSGGWSSDARARIAFLILDAPCHQDSASLSLLHEQILNAAALGVRIVPVVCSGIGESGELLMRSIALATNGTAFFLTDDSGIGHPHLRPTTDSLKVEHLNEMMVRTIVEYSYMPDCKSGLINGDAAEPLNGEMVDPDFLPNPFSAEELAADPSIPHGEGIHYLMDISGKLITVYEGELSALHLPVGVYFIKTYINGKWYTEKVLNR